MIFFHFLSFMNKSSYYKRTQSAEAVEYTDRISAEG